MTRIKIATQIMAALILADVQEGGRAGVVSLALAALSQAEAALTYTDALIKADQDNPGPYIASDDCYGCRKIGSKGPEHMISCQNYRFWKENNG